VVDLIAIAEYLAAHSPAAADKVLLRLRRRADTLVTAAQRGRRVPEFVDFGMTAFRELIDKPYRLICRIEKSQVHVIAVIDGRRNLQDVLFERLMRLR
jgi:toxin ParE1/3/4